jgi:hypothetical protein
MLVTYYVAKYILGITLWHDFCYYPNCIKTKINN